MRRVLGCRGNDSDDSPCGNAGAAESSGTNGAKSGANGNFAEIRGGHRDEIAAVGGATGQSSRAKVAPDARIVQLDAKHTTGNLHNRNGGTGSASHLCELPENLCTGADPHQ